MKIWGTVGILILALSTTSCEEGAFKKLVSSNGGNESHNAGMDCMACHIKNGGGEGRFEAAGTVYDSTFNTILANTLIRLYTGPNGTGDLKYTLEGDAKGNFFTTEKLKFGTGLYPSVEGNNTIKYMSTPITTGRCTSCHGVTTDKIWAE